MPCRGDEGLTSGPAGERPDWWWTGPRPTPSAPGMQPDGTLTSLLLPSLAAVTRQAALDYFDNTWLLTETLFSALQGVPPPSWPDRSAPCCAGAPLAPPAPIPPGPPPLPPCRPRCAAQARRRSTARPTTRCATPSSSTTATSPCFTSTSCAWPACCPPAPSTCALSKCSRSAWTRCGARQPACLAASQPSGFAATAAPRRAALLQCTPLYPHPHRPNLTFPPLPRPTSTPHRAHCR